METHRRAAIRVQRVWRRFVASRRFKQLVWSVCRANALVRGVLVRRHYHRRVRPSLVLLQAVFRRCLISNRIHLQHRCARRIQSWYRGVLSRRSLKTRQHAAKKLQCFMRGVVARARVARLRVAALTITAAVRSAVSSV